MIPFEQVDAGEIPGGGELRLMRRGEDYSILFGPETLMGSRARGSEQALATLAFERMVRPDGAMLIGGLGMGFTLGAALAILPPKATIVVAELVPKVVEWARGPLAHLFGGSLADRRVSIETRDVHDLIEASPGRFDAILLDVDNGPDGMIHRANDRLYSGTGLRAAHMALRPGGVLAVWSAYTDKAFVARMKSAGFRVDEVTVRASGGRKGARHTIWLAVKPGGRAQAPALARERPGAIRRRSSPA